MRALRDESGMVLVELLAGLAIIAVMAGLMAGFLGQLRAVSALEREAQATSELLAGLQILERTIDGARALPLLGPEGAEGLVFIGTGTGLRFTAVTRRGFQALALREMQIGLAGMADGSTNVVVTLLARRQTATTGESFPVSEGVGLAFEYLDEAGVAKPDWQADTLPAAVRITLARSVGPGEPLTVQGLVRLR